MAAAGDERRSSQINLFGGTEQSSEIKLAPVKEWPLVEKASLMMNGSPAIPRLSIKAYGWWNEALHGLARTGLAFVNGLESTWKSEVK